MKETGEVLTDLPCHSQGTVASVRKTPESSVIFFFWFAWLLEFCFDLGLVLFQIPRFKR